MRIKIFEKEYLSKLEDTINKWINEMENDPTTYFTIHDIHYNCFNNKDGNFASYSALVTYSVKKK